MHYTLQATKLRDWLELSAKLETPSDGKSDGPAPILLAPWSRVPGRGSSGRGCRTATQTTWTFFLSCLVWKKKYLPPLEQESHVATTHFKEGRGKVQCHQENGQKSHGAMSLH